MGTFGEIGQAFGQFFGDRKNKKDAKKDQQARLKLIESMNWDPMYASDTSPTFKRTESPIARSYLESFLMGNNPDATFGRRTNADQTKAQQQQSQNAMFGAPEARIARQREIEQETPWKVTAPTRGVTERAGVNSAVGDKSSKDASLIQSQAPRLATFGGTADMYRDLVAHGVLKQGSDIGGASLTLTDPTASKAAIERAYKAKDYEALKRMLNGDLYSSKKEVERYNSKDPKAPLAPWESY